MMSLTDAIRMKLTTVYFFSTATASRYGNYIVNQRPSIYCGRLISILPLLVIRQ